jgi:error-prone DNA polymerase
MTLEDETAIANTIIWPKIYEAFRPVVLGARLVSVTGRLQSESGVIHVVAERIEDLTPLLSRLSQAQDRAQDTSCVEGLARADVKYSNGAPDHHPHRHPRAGDALVTLFRDQPALAGELGLTAEVMPKGRNFH